MNRITKIVYAGGLKKNKSYQLADFRTGLLKKPTQKQTNLQFSVFYEQGETLKCTHSHKYKNQASTKSHI